MEAPTNSDVITRNPLDSLAEAAAANEPVIIPKKRGRPKGCKDSKPRRRPSDPPLPKSNKKRGRPKGSVDTKPRKKKARQSVAAPVPVTGEEKQAAQATANWKKSVTETKAAREALAAAQATLAQAELVEKEAENAHKAAMDTLAESKLRNNNDRWVVYYKCLLDYQATLGNALGGEFAAVPKGHDHPFALLDAYYETHENQRRITLSSWIDTQRAAARKEENNLADWQLYLLKRLKFRPHRGPLVGKWLKKYNTLKEFYNTHGHCNVPKDHELHSWTIAQKCAYRNIAKQQMPVLSEDRIQLLQEIHFEFGQPRQTYTWEERYAELRDFVHIHGHANVSRKAPYVELASWVNKQRFFYKEMKAGRPTVMTQERADKLEAIGFQWSVANQKEKEGVVVI